MTSAPLLSTQAPDHAPLPDWVIEHRGRVVSTQELARPLPAWSAVWADEQTSGRGQADRVFVSDPGGLYLTAVLPYAGDALAARGFALAVGWAVREELLALGVAGLRLRWPNDLMAGYAKVGGILVEQGGPRTLLVGLGLNITNRPWLVDYALGGCAGRISDLPGGESLPEKPALAAALLRAIRRAHEEFGCRHLAGFARLLASSWGEPRAVILEPARGVTLAATCGHFLGIDTSGAVRLRTTPGVEARIPAHHIQRLREVGL